MLIGGLFFGGNLAVVRIGLEEVMSGVVDETDAVERVIAMLESFELDFSGLLAFSVVDKFAFSACGTATAFGVKSLEFVTAENLKLKPPNGVSTVLDVTAFLEAFVVNDLHVVGAVEAADDEESEVVAALKLFETAGDAVDAHFVGVHTLKTDDLEVVDNDDRSLASFSDEIFNNADDVIERNAVNARNNVESVSDGRSISTKGVAGKLTFFVG